MCRVVFCTFSDRDFFIILLEIGKNATMKCLVVLSTTLPDFRWLKWDKSVTFASNTKDDLENGSYQLIDPQYYHSTQLK